MTITIGIIITSVLVVAMCIALIIGLAELVSAIHRIEQLLERIEESLSHAEKQGPKSSAGPDASGG